MMMSGCGMRNNLGTHLSDDLPLASQQTASELERILGRRFAAEGQEAEKLVGPLASAEVVARESRLPRGHHQSHLRLLHLD